MHKYVINPNYPSSNNNKIYFIQQCTFYEYLIDANSLTTTNTHPKNTKDYKKIKKLIKKKNIHKRDIVQIKTENSTGTAIRAINTLLQFVIQKLSQSKKNPQEIIEYIGQSVRQNDAIKKALLNIEANNASLLELVRNLNWDKQYKIQFIQNYANLWNNTFDNLISHALKKNLKDFIPTIVNTLQNYGANNESIIEYLKNNFTKKYYTYIKQITIFKDTCLFLNANLAKTKPRFKNAIEVIITTLQNLGLENPKIIGLIFDIIDTKHHGTNYTEDLNNIGFFFPKYKNIFQKTFSETTLDEKNLKDLIKIHILLNKNIKEIARTINKVNTHEELSAYISHLKEYKSINEILAIALEMRCLENKHSINKKLTKNAQSKPENASKLIQLLNKKELTKCFLQATFQINNFNFDIVFLYEKPLKIYHF